MNRRFGRNIVFFKISLKWEYTQLALRVFSLQFNFSKYNVPPASTDSLHNIIPFISMYRLQIIKPYWLVILHTSRLCFQNACGTPYSCLYCTSANMGLKIFTSNHQKIFHWFNYLFNRFYCLIHNSCFEFD